jgi:hypothetical protein
MSLIRAVSSFLSNKVSLTFEQAMLCNYSKRTLVENSFLIPDSSQFKDVVTCFNGDVTVSVAKIPGGYLIKPKHPHYKYQFEAFFKLGAGNLGIHEYYTKKRYIFLPD